MNEHHRAPHGAALFQRVAEKQIVVIFQTHAAQHDDIHLRLHGDAGQELVIRFAGYGENGELLALHQCVEHVDHGDAGADHLVGNGTLGRVYRRAADGDHVLCESGAVVAGHAGAVENASQQMLGERHHHGSAQKADRIRGAHALRAAEHLQRH